MSAFTRVHHRSAFTVVVPRRHQPVTNALTSNADGDFHAVERSIGIESVSRKRTRYWSESDEGERESEAVMSAIDGDVDDDSTLQDQATFAESARSEPSKIFSDGSEHNKCATRRDPIRRLRLYHETPNLVAIFS